MNTLTKIDASRQSVLSNLTLSEISNVIDEGDTILYRRLDGSLGMAVKTGGIAQDVNPGGDILKNLLVPELPVDFPENNKAYALSAVRDGFQFKLVWALVDTLENYNEL